MKAYDVAVDQQLSGAEKNTDVAINVQLGGVQLYVVLIMLCMGRDWNRIANALRGWSTKAWRLFFLGVFPEGRCKVDGGAGSFVGHERCGGRSLRHNGRRRDLFKIIQRCFREFWHPLRGPDHQRFLGSLRGYARLHSEPCPVLTSVSLSCRPR